MARTKHTRHQARLTLLARQTQPACADGANGEDDEAAKAEKKARASEARAIKIARYKEAKANKKARIDVANAKKMAIRANIADAQDNYRNQSVL